MTAKKKNTYGQIAIYPTDELRKKIKVEAEARRRKLGPTVLEIVIEFFAKKDADAARTL